MSMFKKLFGKSEEKSVAEQAPIACPHTVLLPRWDNAADMGQQDKITGYTCQACDAFFTAAEGRALQAKETERIQELVAETPET